ncbi:MAG: bleomycin resistance family protein [Chitinophaga sp.]|jgi:catechol 2,3-dioxygenase-like lactoylglutathione lyase family enzyme|nr:bleomycin resistance family protein [Chitinophaga sp.]
MEKLTPLLWTNDLQATIEFYTGILHFELDEYNADWGWCHLHNNAVSIMFSKPNEHAAYNGSPMLTGSFYIYIATVDELWNKVKDKTKVVYNLANFEHGMREFAIYDNNGYMLQFGRGLKEGEEPDTFG